MEITRACPTREEIPLLHAALADFSPNGARIAYAKWLEENGEKGRARAVLATVEAYHDLAPDPLKDLGVDPCWARMIAIPLLSALIEAGSDHNANALRALRDKAFFRLRPALSLSYSPSAVEPKVGASYLWGLPDIPDGETWPKIGELSNWSDGRQNLPQDHHAAFVGQIAFKDMRDTVLGQDLPQEGGFAVFSITETWKFGVAETLVRPWNTATALQRCPTPRDLIEDELGDGANSPQPAHVVRLEEALSLPDATDGPFAALIPGCRYDEPHFDLYRRLLDACGAGDLGFGGYLRGTSGADPSPDTNSLRFAVLRTTTDVGTVHFAIPTADLKGGRLDRVQYVWNDWDS